MNTSPADIFHILHPFGTLWTYLTLIYTPYGPSLLILSPPFLAHYSPTYIPALSSLSVFHRILRFHPSRTSPEYHSPPHPHSFRSCLFASPSWDAWQKGKVCSRLWVSLGLWKLTRRRNEAKWNKCVFVSYLGVNEVRWHYYYIDRRVINILWYCQCHVTLGPD